MHLILFVAICINHQSFNFIFFYPLVVFAHILYLLFKENNMKPFFI